jgi:hypothetical protein
MTQPILPVSPIAGARLFARFVPDVKRRGFSLSLSLSLSLCGLFALLTLVRFPGIVWALDAANLA